MNGRLNEWLVCRYIGRQSAEHRAEDGLFLFRPVQALRVSSRLQGVTGWMPPAALASSTQTRDAAGPSRGRRPRLGLPCRVPDEQRMDEKKGQKGTERGGRIGSCRVVSSEAPRVVPFQVFFSLLRSPNFSTRSQKRPAKLRRWSFGLHIRGPMLTSKAPGTEPSQGGFRQAAAETPGKEVAAVMEVRCEMQDARNQSSVPSKHFGLALVVAAPS